MYFSPLLCAHPFLFDLISQIIFGEEENYEIDYCEIFDS